MKNSNTKNVISIGIREGSLYKLCNSTNLALNHETQKTNEIWHRRLGHLNFRALSCVEKFVKGLPNLKYEHEGICKGCALGKNPKTPFHSSEHKSKSILELIHTGLCGPMSVPSLGGYSTTSSL